VAQIFLSLISTVTIIIVIIITYYATGSSSIQKIQFTQNIWNTRVHKNVSNSLCVTYFVTSTTTPDPQISDMRHIR